MCKALNQPHPITINKTHQHQNQLKIKTHFKHLNLQHQHHNQLSISNLFHNNNYHQNLKNHHIAMITVGSMKSNNSNKYKTSMKCAIIF